jgi:acyl-CoA hydrolase
MVTTGANNVTEARLIEIVFPEQTNHYGTLFGGEALVLMAKAAFVLASRYARRKMVLASSDRVDFHEPVQQGWMVEVVARVVATGNTSMTVDVALYAEHLVTGERQRAARGDFVFVALDAHDKSTPVPPFRAPEAGSSPPPSDVETIEAGRLTEARLIELVFPEQTNHYGTLFGGEALALMDKAAFIAASRYARRTVVTASNERVDFHVPVRTGELVDLVARVVAAGRTSLTVEVELSSEDLLTGARQVCTRGRVVLVAIDADGRTAPILSLTRSEAG